jgi:hypothetical protein
MEWFTPNDTSGLNAWDGFLRHSPRGHYCQLSTWLESFRAYGFSFHVLVAKDSTSGDVLGGAGILEFGNRAFRLANAPIAPIVDTGQESLVKPILAEMQRWARARGVVALQFRFPCPMEGSLAALLPPGTVGTEQDGHAGEAFSTGAAPNQMLWIDLAETIAAGTADWREAVLARFSSMTRRNIRTAERQELELVEPRSEDEIRAAFALVEENGRRQGYSTRVWRDFGPALVSQVNRGHAIVLAARHAGELVGVHYGVIAGRRYSYIMGGTRRSESLKTGHFLHWQAIQRAHDLGLLGYDLTSGGSEGVMRFKMGFNPQTVRFVSPRYCVISPVRYAAFAKLQPWLRRHKARIGNLLSSLQRLRGTPPAVEAR